MVFSESAIQGDIYHIHIGDVDRKKHAHQSLYLDGWHVLALYTDSLRVPQSQWHCPERYRRCCQEVPVHVHQGLSHSVWYVVALHNVSSRVLQAWWHYPDQYWWSCQEVPVHVHQVLFYSVWYIVALYNVLL